MFSTMAEISVSCLIGIIKIGVHVHDLLTFPFYFLTRKDTVQEAKKTCPAVRTAVSEGICYRGTTPLTDIQIAVKRQGIDTVEKAHRYALEKFTNKPCMGTRQRLREFEEEQPSGKVFTKYELGDYTWQTYAQVAEQSTHMSRALRQFGCKKDQPLMILSDTRAEWLITLISAFKQSIPVCTLYPNLGLEGLIHGINETKIEVLVTSHDMMPKVKQILDRCPCLETIVYFADPLVATDTEGCEAVDVYSFDEVIEMGKKMSFPENPPQPDDMAVVMYTSGSTGTPKGVELSHRNLMTAMTIYIGAFDPRVDDCYAAYLPLAHVLELVAENVMFVLGVSLGYSTPTTLTTRSTKIKRGQQGDLNVLKPTFFTAVPLIMDRIHKGVLEIVSGQSQLIQRMFAYGLGYKEKWYKAGYKSPICDWFLFRKVKRTFGGSLRLIAVGGAPLGGETQDFMRMATGLPIVQGYGLTETCGCATLMARTDPTIRRVGQPLLGSDVKLIDWEEGNYRITDKPNPRGEVCIGGDHVAVGYFKNPAKTAEEFFEADGRRWFRTGDIGEYQPDGGLCIVDRKKDLVKLQIGEYVSLAKVEGALFSSPLVENICVYGDSNKNNVVAILSPSPAALDDVAATMNKQHLSIEQLCEDKQIIQHYLKQLVVTGKGRNLEKFELPTALHLSPETWTPDNGLVTAAFKLKRVAIKTHFQDAINRMYGA